MNLSNFVYKKPGQLYENHDTDSLDDQENQADSSEIMKCRYSNHEICMAYVLAGFYFSN